MSHITQTEDCLIIKIRTVDPDGDRNRLLELFGAHLRWYSTTDTIRHKDRRLLNLQGELITALSNSND